MKINLFNITKNLVVASLVVLFFYSCQLNQKRQLASNIRDEAVNQQIVELYKIHNQVLKLKNSQKEYQYLISLNPVTRTQSKDGTRVDTWRLDALKKSLANVDSDLIELNDKANSIKEELKSFNEQNYSSKDLSHPIVSVFNTSDNFRSFEEDFEISGFGNYQKKQNGTFRTKFLDLENTNTFTLSLIQHLQPAKINYQGAEIKPLRPIDASIKCSGKIKINNVVEKKLSANEKYTFQWYQSDGNGQRIKLNMTRESGRCELRFADEKGTWEYGVDVVAEKDYVSNALKPFVGRFELCQIPDAKKMSLLDQWFLSTDIPALICPHSVNDIKTLENQIEAMQTKVYALLGQRLPEDMIKKQDPYYPLDFSKAPKLDAVYVSYLNIHADFYGTVLLRLLRYHAEHGTIVKILVADVSAGSEDQVAYKKFRNEVDNVNIRLYRFSDYDSKFIIAPLHRVNHIKMLVTYSKDREENNVAFFGGRNVNDGMLFNSKPNLKKYPELIQYGKGLNIFVHWTDFEVEIKSRSLVESVIGQYNSIYAYDSDSLFFRDYTINQKLDSEIDPEYLNTKDGKILVRHFVSIPYRDGMSLEKLIGRLIDSAKYKIVMSTPYFSLTQELKAAFERATKRGIKVKLITRLDLSGDTMASIITDVNKQAVNDFYKDFEIYDFARADDILHSKLILIDDQITTVSSVNFNQRSFYHDLENGVLIKSEKFNQKVEGIINSYLKEAKRITKEQKAKFWNKLIINMMKTEF